MIYILLQLSDKINASLQNLLKANQHLNPTMITNIGLDLYLTIMWTSADFEWNQCIPSHVIERNEQLKLSQKKKKKKKKKKKAITQPKFGGWLPISNLTCILQWYKLLQTLNESMNPFISYWAETKSVTTTATTTPTTRSGNMIPMCLQATQKR